jgi:hypothetical protein
MEGFDAKSHETMIDGQIVLNTKKCPQGDDQITLDTKRHFVDIERHLIVYWCFVLLETSGERHFCFERNILNIHFRIVKSAHCSSHLTSRLLTLNSTLFQILYH